MDPWKFWNDTLKSPRFVLAPMVDHSELPWRMLSREYGCQLAYTPMFHAANFANSAKYRQRSFTTCSDDRPLIVQFCANDAETLLHAARFIQGDCDGVDINLGCPQDIARRGHYGAFLQDEWDLINEMVSKLRNNLDNMLSVSCKIRRFEDVQKTVDYAKMLEKAGCTFIGIHARTRAQRGTITGLADWTYIKAVKESVNVPVIANGNIQSLSDAERCMEETKADAVMTAEGNLYNPALFDNIHPPAWVIATKYLDYVRKYPIPAGMAKSHIFKLFHRCVAMDENADLRIKLGKSTTIEHLYEVVNLFKLRYNSADDEDQTLTITVQPVPPYLCQPRFKYGGVIEAKTESLEDKITTKTLQLTTTNDDYKRIKLGP